MQKILDEFLKCVRACEGMNEPLSLERFCTFLRGLRELQNVIAAAQRRLQGNVAPPELKTLQEETTRFMDRWEAEWEQFLAAPRPPFQPILYFEEFSDWKPLQHDIESFVRRCRELTAAIAKTAGIPFNSNQFMDIRECYGTVPREPPVEVPETVPDNEDEP